jgi:hypothetical protein
MAEELAVRQLEAALTGLAVLGPTSYAWLGQEFDLPAHIRRLAPPKALESALVHAMQWRLYADFFTPGGPTPPRRRLPRSPDRSFARALSAANAGTVATEPGWRVVGADDGRLVVERVGLRLWMEPDEVVGEGPPRAGDMVAVRLPAEAPNFSPGFYMAMSDRGLDADTPRLLDRYYLHVRPDHAVRCVELATARLNAAGLAFRLKILDDPATFGRCDSAVLWMQRKDREVALDHMEALHELLRPGLDDAVPALTLELLPGLGFAEDQGDGGSFGSHRCRLIAAAALASHDVGATAIDERMEILRVKMAEAGTTPEAPYLGPSSAGNPRTPVLAPSDREEVPPCRS